jgi:hypothetical protein
MSTEIIVALITSGIALIGSIVTFIIGLSALKSERQKLQIDRERLQLDGEKLKAELANLNAETTRLRLEADDTRRRNKQLEQTRIELDREKELTLINRKFAIYPEILELVYRLRNEIRDFYNSVNEVVNGLGENQMISDFVGSGTVYTLTENLYRYRAFIDNDAFEKLHRLKRLGQDVVALQNRMTRPLDVLNIQSGKNPKSVIDAMQVDERLKTKDAHELLVPIQQEVEQLYTEITRIIKAKLQSHLNEE